MSKATCRLKLPLSLKRATARLAPEDVLPPDLAQHPG